MGQYYPLFHKAERSVGFYCSFYVSLWHRRRVKLSPGSNLLVKMLRIPRKVLSCTCLGAVKFPFVWEAEHVARQRFDQRVYCSDLMRLLMLTYLLSGRISDLVTQKCYLASQCSGSAYWDTYSEGKGLMVHESGVPRGSMSFYFSPVSFRFIDSQVRLLNTFIRNLCLVTSHLYSSLLNDVMECDFLPPFVRNTSSQKCHWWLSCM